MIKYVNNSVNLLSQLGNTFNHLQNKEKSSFLRVIYPENIILEKECFRTNSENTIVELMTSIYGGLQNTEMKKATLSNGFSNVAPPSIVFSNQIYEDLKKINDLKGFLNTSSLMSFTSWK